MANSFLPQTQDTLESSLDVLPTQLESSPPFSSEDKQPEENYALPPKEIQNENEHFLEEENSPEEEIVEMDTPSLTPAQVATRVVPSQPVKPIPIHRDPLTIQIEKILEEDLGDVYIALTTVQKQQFKIKGEETAHKIRQTLQGTKVKLGKIIKLIFDWLKILPGINRFFLEQEAKIKADKIVALKDQNKFIS